MEHLPLSTLALHIESGGFAAEARAEPAAHVAVDPRRVLQLQLLIIAALAAASTIAGAALYFLGWPEESFGYAMVKLFWLDTEHNIPTLYQCSAMLAAAALLVLLGQRYKARLMPSTAWYGLAAAFVFLAIDEGAQVHEAIGVAYGTSFGASWTFFYVPVGLVLLAVIVPFLRRLPARIRRLMVASGALYVVGGVAVEAVGQAYADVVGKAVPLYAGLATLEEVLEMAGVALLIFTLLEHLRTLDSPSRR